MGWKERTVKQMREELVRRALSKESTIAALCREYGISRPTAYKWISRYQNNQSMEDLSRAPFHQPKRTDANTEALIVAMRRQYPAIGATKIRKMLLNDGHKDLPCARTFNNIFHRNNLITREASEAARPYERFQKSYPNEMWQADFKGHFLMGDQNRCHPLNILDDFSRCSLCCEPLSSETLEAVQPVLIRTFLEYGLPFSFLCDNGNPWGTAQSTGYTRFEVWLMELGILTIHGRILHPQTQGKEERFNRSMKNECLKYHEIENLAMAKEIFDEYRNFYNHVRPHCALGLDVPASRYKRSSREYPKQIEEWDYGPEYVLRKVKSSGYFSYNNHGYFLSEAFGGKTIAIRPSQLDGQITLVFRQFRIGRIDPEKRVFTMKRAYLLEGDPRNES